MLLTAVFAFPSHAAERLTAKDYVKRSDDLMRGETNQGIYSMTITTPSWERTLKLNVIAKGRDRTFIRILQPPKEAGIGTLRVGNEMWNYLPAVEKTIKIPPSMMLQPWMGSDFANDDLVKESSIVNDYTHHFVDSMFINGHNIVKIELRPKPDAPVIWGLVLRWIRQEDFVPLKEAYYNEKKELIKTLFYSDIGEMSDRVLPRLWEMRSEIEPEKKTVIKMIDVKYDKSVDDRVFTQAYLKKIQ